MIDAELPPKFWAEATNTAVQIHRITPQQNLGPGGWHTPHEMLFESVPACTHLRRFGSLCYIHVPEECRKDGKFGPRSEPGVMLGYVSKTTKMWRCWNFHLHKAENYSDVQFVEDKNGWTGPKSSMEDYDLLPSLNDALAPGDDEDEPMHDHHKAMHHRTKNNVFSKTVAEVDRLRRMSINKVICAQAKLVRSPEDQLLHRVNALRVSTNTDQNSYEEAMRSPDSASWKEAMAEEFASLLANKTFDLGTSDTASNKASKPTAAEIESKAISSRWVFRKKTNPDGSIRFKARLVVRGFEQEVKEGEVTYAPVAKLGTYRMLLAASVSRNWRNEQLDVKTAFLNPDIEDEDIYVRLPPGVPAEYGPILRIEKALYGLRTSPIRWFNLLEKFLLSLGFTKSNFEETLYLMPDCICLVYVDDIQLWATSDDHTALENVISKLKERFAMTSLGQTQQFLGLEVHYERDDGYIAVCQEGYIDATVARFPEMKFVKPALSPMDLQVQLFNGKCEDGQLSRWKAREYLSLVGSLVWISTSTRPDISFATSALAAFNSKPLKKHWTAALRVLSYLRATKSVGLQYNANPFWNGEPVVAFSDSDWASNTSTRKSQGGYTTMTAGCATIWKSRPQKCVSLSSTEAEFYAASEAIKAITHTRALLRELGNSLSSDKLPPSAGDPPPAENDILSSELAATRLCCDNAAAIKIYESGHFNERSKHIAVRVMHAFDETKAGVVKLEWIPSAQNPADCLTKGLPRSTNDVQRNLIGLREFTSDDDASPPTPPPLSPVGRHRGGA